MILAIALTLFYPAPAGREHSCFMTASGAPDWFDAVCFGSNQIPLLISARSRRTTLTDPLEGFR